MMRYFWILTFLISATINGQNADILIKNGKILDGTGNSWFYGDLAIQNGKIAAIGKLANWTATKSIDVTGLMVTPGFIDVHTHIEGDEKKILTEAKKNKTKK